MRARMTMMWENVSTSLWFVPGMLTVGAVLLAWLALAPPIDVADRFAPAWWLYSGKAKDASALLGVLFTSMITMATLAVSITMVVLTLAAAQLGPRLIRSFMADRRTQLMLGFFLATIVYLVLVLRAVNAAANDDGVPHLAVTIATASVLICVFMLLFFVHHLARSIVADTVIRRVGDDLDSAIAAMLPKADGAEAGPAAPPRPSGGAPLRLPKGGYVQAMSYDEMVRCAKAADAFIELDFRPGHHLLAEGEHGRVHPASALNFATRKEIADCVLIGGERTPTQDIEFAVRQLVEIALRALSPGVNDPFTAIAVIDRLGVSLALMMGRGAAVGAWRDEDGKVRVVGPTTTLRGAVDAAFNQIRQSGEGHPAILIRLSATFAQLAEHARDDEARRVLADHVAMIATAAKRSIAERADLADVEEALAAALDRLEAR